MTASREESAEVDRQEAIEQLRQYLKPGDNIYCIVTTVAKDGLSRKLKSFVAYINEKKKPGIYCIDHLVGRSLRWHFNGNGVTVAGAGSDAGSELAYSISRLLFPAGFKCVGDRCPSTDHHKRATDRKKNHKDSGYALRRQWL